MATGDNAAIGLVSGLCRNPFSRYVGEILDAEGFTYSWVEDRFDGDLLIAPSLTDTPPLVGEWAAAGKNLLALRPPPELLPLFGLRSKPGRPLAWSDRYLRCRDETVLQYHGAADLVQAAGAEVLAWLQFDLDDPPSAHPAIVRLDDGARRAAFTFDLAQSTLLFRQGRADQASDGTNPDPDGDEMFKAADLFVNFLDPRLKASPQADHQLDLFVALIWWLTEKTAPVPRVWRFPSGQPAAALMSGDSDGCAAEGLHLAFDLAQ